MNYAKKIYFTIFILQSGLFLCFSNLYAQPANVIAYAQTDSFFIIRYDEKVDSASAATIENYHVNNGISLSRVVIDCDDERTVVLVSNETLNLEEYTVTISGQKLKASPGETIPEFSVVAARDDHPWFNLPVDIVEGISHHSYWSESNNRLLGYSMYLPPNYDSSTDSIPILYFLGGIGNNENTQHRMWVSVFHNAILEGDIPPTIIAFPNPMPGSWYEDGEPYNSETMIIKELIPHIDKSYRAYKSRNGRWISGFSMGGYGSLHLGFKYPELFGSIVSYSAARIPEIPFPEKIRNKTTILLAVGEVDSYFLFTVLPTFNALQEFKIPSSLKSLPAVEHSISNIFKLIGIDGIKRHWQSLGGFNEYPIVDAGIDQEIKYSGSASTFLKGKITDDDFSSFPLRSWWTAANLKGSIDISDSLDLNSSISFSAEGEYIIVLHGDDTKFHKTDTLIIKVTSNPINKAPEIAIGRDKLISLPSNTMDLSPIVSDDGLPLNSILSYNWSALPSGGISFSEKNKPDTKVTFSQPGKYLLKLEANDSELTTSDSLYVSIMEADQVIPEIFIPMDDGAGSEASNLSMEKGNLKMEGFLWSTDPDMQDIQVKYTNDKGKGFIDISEIPFFSQPVSQRTISLWFKVNSNRPLPQVLYDEGGFTNGISIVKTGGFIYATISSEEQKTSLKTNFNFTKGWQNLVLIIENDKMSFYLNGIKMEEKTIINPGFITNSEPLGIGAAINTTAESIADGEGSVSQNYDGFLNELRIYNSVLNEDEIKRIAGTTGTVLSSIHNSILIWPNPGSGLVNISLPDFTDYEIYELKIYDIQGRIVFFEKGKYGDSDFSLDLTCLNPGVYFVKIEGEKIFSCKKFIIQ